MKSPLIVFCALSMMTAPALAVETLAVKVTGITEASPIPEKFAYCAPDGKGKTKDAGNISPEIQWAGAPEGTRSFSIIMVDRDVPATFELANQEGKEIPYDFARQDFYHWVLVDIPANITGFPEGKDSRGITPGGKLAGRTAYGTSGQNDYIKVFSGEANSWGGYDGPCPPWNDQRLHHYHFIVYALNTETLGLEAPFSGRQAEDAMAGHILAKGEVMGTYKNR